MTTMNREEQKQVLIDTANHIIHRDNTSPYSENLRELARIALAALEVEPIGFRCRRNDNLGDWSYVYHREPDDFERKHLVIEGIYAAPPAPVPLTEVQRAMLRDMDVEISAELEEEEEIYRDGIRKCIAALRYHHKRAETCSNGYTGSTLEEDTLKSINFLKRNNIAAMLQSGNFRENKNSSTNNFREISETSTNSPVIPDGWISCSERIPAQDDWVLIYSKHGEYMAGQVQGEYVELSDGTLSWLGNALYWMLLPEPPQGVNDELA
ncbi:TPA: DUF551 domain-containing protein [Escherichia coli]